MDQGSTKALLLPKVNFKLQLSLLFFFLLLLTIYSGKSSCLTILSILIFGQILSVIVRVIQKDAEEKRFSFSPRPYFRLFINWLLDLTSPDIVDSVNFQVQMFMLLYFNLLFWVCLSTAWFISCWSVTAGVDIFLKCFPCIAAVKSSWMEVCHFTYSEN